MIMLENDDKVFTLWDTLYLCEKLSIPMIFDYHHHLANCPENGKWEKAWDRVLGTWRLSELPVKMHISSPRSKQKFRALADYVNSDMFMGFLRTIKGSVSEIDCMIEVKQKDDALFKLMEDLKQYSEVEIIDGASFYIH